MISNEPGCIDACIMFVADAMKLTQHPTTWASVCNSKPVSDRVPVVSVVGAGDKSITQSGVPANHGFVRLSAANFDCVAMVVTGET